MCVYIYIYILHGCAKQMRRCSRACSARSYMYVSMSVCVCVCIYIQLLLFRDVASVLRLSSVTAHTLVCIYIHTHTHTLVCTYTHTHTHTLAT